MSARLIADEYDPQLSSVEDYRRKIYSILDDGWYDDTSLEHIPGLLEQSDPAEGAARRRSERAYHLLTQFPRRPLRTD